MMLMACLQRRRDAQLATMRIASLPLRPAAQATMMQVARRLAPRSHLTPMGPSMVHRPTHPAARTAFLSVNPLRQLSHRRHPLIPLLPLPCRSLPISLKSRLACSALSWPRLGRRTALARRSASLRATIRTLPSPASRQSPKTVPRILALHDRLIAIKAEIQTRPLTPVRVHRHDRRAFRPTQHPDRSRGARRIPSWTPLHHHARRPPRRGHRIPAPPPSHQTPARRRGRQTRLLDRVGPHHLGPLVAATTLFRSPQCRHIIQSLPSLPLPLPLPLYCRPLILHLLHLCHRRLRRCLSYHPQTTARPGRVSGIDAETT